MIWAIVGLLMLSPVCSLTSTRTSQEYEKG